MINTIENDDEHLVHMCFCDEASQILNNRCLRSKRYLSFSRGMPLKLSHGETIIIFNRKKLENKGYKFINIEYERKFFENNPELKEHVHGNDLEIDDVNKKLMKKIKDLKGIDSKSRKIYKKMLKEYNKTDIINHIIKACRPEKESVLCNDIMNFEIEDVDAIISPSIIFQKYYPFPKQYTSKILNIQDYYPIHFNINSQLYKYIKYIDKYYNVTEQINPHANFTMTKIYHYIYIISINNDLKMMTKYDPKNIIELSPLYEKAIKLLPKLEKDEKLKLIDRLLKYIIYNIDNPTLEKSILSICSNR